MKEWILAHQKILASILLSLKILGTLCIIIGFCLSWFYFGTSKWSYGEWSPCTGCGIVTQHRSKTCQTGHDCTGEIVQEEKSCTATDKCKSKYFFQILASILIKDKNLIIEVKKQRYIGLYLFFS